jgi:hypothetical protein
MHDKQAPKIAFNLTIKNEFSRKPWKMHPVYGSHFNPDCAVASYCGLKILAVPACRDTIWVKNRRTSSHHDTPCCEEAPDSAKCLSITPTFYNLSQESEYRDFPKITRVVFT